MIIFPTRSILQKGVSQFEKENKIIKNETSLGCIINYPS